MISSLYIDRAWEGSVTHFQHIAHLCVDVKNVIGRNILDGAVDVILHIRIR
jgi:hypothetical protein